MVLDTHYGIGIADYGTNHNTVEGNYIGVEADGVTSNKNLLAGVWVKDSAKYNTIGGDAGNLIAFNGSVSDGRWTGVLIDGPSTLYNIITRNRITSNLWEGIDLYNGGNGEISAPTISKVELIDTDVLSVTGSGAGSNSTVEVFRADSETSGQGELFLGTVTADSSGDFEDEIDVSGFGVSAGEFAVATTTHTNGNTSEFSDVSEILPDEPTGCPAPYDGYDCFAEEWGGDPICWADSGKIVCQGYCGDDSFVAVSNADTGAAYIWGRIDVRDISGPLFPWFEWFCCTPADIGNVASLEIDGDDGDDTIRLQSGTWTWHQSSELFGHYGDDTIYGGNDSSYSDEINGGYGDDTLYGLAGSDTLNGDQGNDTIYGGSGNDVIKGGPSMWYIGEPIIDDDCLFGESGNDTIYGYAGDDGIDGGGNGKFPLVGPKDNLYGGLDDDYICGGQDMTEDYLNGSLGTDTCTDAAQDTATGCESYFASQSACTFAIETTLGCVLP